MRESTTKNNIFLCFKFDLRFLRILKLLHIYIFWSIIYLIFVSVFHFSPMFPFYTGLLKYKKRPSNENRFRHFFSLVKVMQKKSIYLEVDEQIQLILPVKSTSDGGISVSKMKKVRLVFYTVPYSFYCKRVSVCFLYFFQ